MGRRERGNDPESGLERPLPPTTLRVYRRGSPAPMHLNLESYGFTTLSTAVLYTTLCRRLARTHARGLPVAKREYRTFSHHICNTIVLVC